jgi:hypothetical protein
MSVPVQQMDPLAIGHKLLVQFVLAGSFFRSEQGFDLNWQLLDVPGESVKAGGAISVPSFDLVAVQNEICTEVFSSLQGLGQGFVQTRRSRAAAQRRWPTLLGGLSAGRAMLSSFMQRTSSRKRPGQGAGAI